MNAFKNTCLLLLLLISSLSCDTSIVPITGGDQQYSIYGPLNIAESPNYIRVHNSKAVLNADATLPLNVTMEITNLNSGFSEMLDDRLVQFRGIYTHNFRIDMPIEFDTRYRVDLEDLETGITSSLTSVTTKQSEITILEDSVGCNTPFRIQLSNIDLEAGERLDTEVAVKIGDDWRWTPRSVNRVYDDEAKTLTLSWTPNEISSYIMGPLDFLECCEFTSKKIQFRFTHIGYVEGNEDASLPDSSELDWRLANKQIVLSKYSDEAEIRINPCINESSPVACNVKW
ncbi:hypothetical protein [Gracilimonas sp.]|uniref:hypothetical protein n=1 Tax=Gracilimonas sp. TaxID=1974203 RepID=UPI003BAD88B5